MDIASVLNSFELSLVSEATSLVDLRISAIEARAKQSPDPDGEGLFDQMEFLAGFGLVACQAYVTTALAELRVDKRAGLAVGPQHSSTYSMVYLVNALANYWKHSSEWNLPLPARAQETANAVSSLGVDLDAPYVIVNALTELLRPAEPRVSRIVPFLAQWRDAFR